ncbi:MAG: efflux RND transporter periplasmic adaptor subunit, partial [Oceanobacter sp.]
PERVEQAKAALAEQELAVDGAQKLSTQGLSNALELARAKTALANAKANLTNAQIQLDATRVRAPFDAILNERKIELGDLIHDGTELFDLIDTAPYLVIAQVPENQAHLVKTDQKASAELLSGQVVHGRIRYKSTQADANTRTYRIELEIANPERQPVALGASAKLRIPTGNASVYEVSPTLLVISETGGLGVKTVSPDNRVQFNPVELYESDATRVWITGLEPGSRLITRGAGFVEPGDQVTPVAESTEVEN